MHLLVAESRVVLPSFHTHYPTVSRSAHIVGHLPVLSWDFIRCRPWGDHEGLDIGLITHSSNGAGVTHRMYSLWACWTGRYPGHAVLPYQRGWFCYKLERGGFFLQLVFLGSQLSCLIPDLSSSMGGVSLRGLLALLASLTVLTTLAAADAVSDLQTKGRPNVNAQLAKSKNCTSAKALVRKEWYVVFQTNNNGQ